MSLFVITMLMLSILAAHLLNTKKIEDRDLKFIFQSTLEGFFGFLFIYFFFLQGYISLFVIVSILVVLMIATGLVLFMRESQFDTWDLVIETSKNVIIIFLKTVLPIMFFLTVFRFQAWYLQIVFTLGAIILLVLVLKGIAFLLRTPIDKVMLAFSMSNFQMIVTLWIVSGVFFLVIWTFNIPVERLEYNMNLANATTYLEMDGYETKLLNEFKDEEILRFETDTFDVQIDDYYIEGKDLYLYTGRFNRDIIVHINTETNERNTYTFKDDSIIVSPSNLSNTNPLNFHFTKVDDGVILTGDIGVYHIDGSDITTMITYQEGSHDTFLMDDAYYVLARENSSNYTIYSYNDKALTIDQTVNINDTSYPDSYLEVYSKGLYYKTKDQLIDFNETISFDITGIELPIDIKNGYLYSAVHDLITIETTYYKIQEADQETFSYSKYHNNVPLAGDDYIFYLDLTGTGKMLNEYRRINIHNDDLTANSVVYHTENKPFNRNDNWIYKYVVDYKVDGNDLYYLQVEYNDDGALMTHHKVTKSETFGIPFTFYSHLGIGMLPIIIAAVFIPVTNYRDYITIISLENILKKKTQ